jgi:RND family efflux transporter MFP subunit
MPVASARRSRLRVATASLLTAALLASGVAGFAGLAAFRKEPARDAAAPWTTTVRVQIAERKDHVEWIEGYGKARCLRAAEVLAEVTGVVSWLAPKLESGGEVTSGEELLRIDPRDFEIALAQAMAQHEQARADLARTESDVEGMREQLVVAETALAAGVRELQRAEQLVEADLIADKELDAQRRLTDLLERQTIELRAAERAAVPRLEWSRADCARAKSAVDKARLDLERTTIRAPFEGRIERRVIDIGRRVAPGLPVFAIADLSRIEVPIALPGSRFGEVAVGAAAHLRLREDDAIAWRGKVARVAPSIDPRNRTFEVFLEIEGDPYRSSVPPGSFVLGAVEGRVHEGVIAVPRGAFVDGHLYVATPYDGDGGDEDLATVARITPVVRRLLADVALVDDGIDEGARVIVSNVERIAKGSTVRVAAEAVGPAER